MEIKIREGSTQPQNKVRIAQNLKKESVMLDRFGNRIDPKTRQIIETNDDKE